MSAREENSGDSRFQVTPSMQAKLCVRTQTTAAQETVDPAVNKIIKTNYARARNPVGIELLSLSGLFFITDHVVFSSFIHLKIIHS